MSGSPSAGNGTPAVAFVDCHSHLVPSGDDGVKSVEQAAALCNAAAQRGTRLLFATPHVSSRYPLDGEREARVRAARDEIRTQIELELRLGWELAATPDLLEHPEPERLALEGTSFALVEAPLSDPLDTLIALCERFESAGITPIIAHPEECGAIGNDSALARGLAERGWPLALSGRGILAQSGQIVETISWRLLESGLARIVASDGHDERRPPFLDGAHTVARERLGARADALFDGSWLTDQPAA